MAKLESAALSFCLSRPGGLYSGIKNGRAHSKPFSHGYPFALILNEGQPRETPNFRLCVIIDRVAIERVLKFDTAGVKDRVK